ncbi:MAG: DegV family protein [Oscillospiraceae bacterium]|jgi:DegV family protein with EDD domain|nr:DegV family protein [Oscillospiraceae bacterium]
MTRIIVDSTCDLPDDVVKRYGITVVPMVMSLRDREYRDKVNIRAGEVYAAMRSGVVPKTSQIDCGALMDVFSGFCEAGVPFVYLAFSSALSGSCNTARILLADYREQYPGLDMEVIDSKSGSVATGLIAMRAAARSESGVSFAELVSHILELTEHVEHVFTIADLKWLVRGGRIDPIVGMIGSLLNVKPILDVKNGSMQIIKKVRGDEAARAEVVSVTAARARSFPEQLIGIAHAENLPGAEALKRAIAETLGATNFIISEIGSVLGSHIGVGSLGVFFFNKRFAPTTVN